MEITVEFGAPFAHTGYTLVAMTTHPACYAVLKSQDVKSAVIQIVSLHSDQSGQQLAGAVHWIAIGDKAPDGGAGRRQRRKRG
jgi:hypothetical protein